MLALLSVLLVSLLIALLIGLLIALLNAQPMHISSADCLAHCSVHDAAPSFLVLLFLISSVASLRAFVHCCMLPLLPVSLKKPDATH